LEQNVYFTSAVSSNPIEKSNTRITRKWTKNVSLIYLDEKNKSVNEQNDLQAYRRLIVRSGDEFSGTNERLVVSPRHHMEDRIVLILLFFSFSLILPSLSWHRSIFECNASSQANGHLEYFCVRSVKRANLRDFLISTWAVNRDAVRWRGYVLETYENSELRSRSS